MPKHPLASVIAFVDFKRFGVLPYAGGTFDQPSDLMDEMRLIHDVLTDKEIQRLKAEMAKTKG